MTEEKNKPSLELRLGNTKLIVWENKKVIDGKEVVFDSVHLEQVFKDKDDNWKSNSNFNKNQLIDIKRLIDDYLKLRFPIKNKTEENN